MLVSISKAAKMVDVTRATFYRHVQRKRICIQYDDDGNPKVNVAELLRVYGAWVRQNEHDFKDDSPDTGNTRLYRCSLLNTLFEWYFSAIIHLKHYFLPVS